MYTYSGLFLKSLRLHVVRRVSMQNFNLLSRRSNQHCASPRYHHSCDVETPIAWWMAMHPVTRCDLSISQSIIERWRCATRTWVIVTDARRPSLGVARCWFCFRPKSMSKSSEKILWKRTTKNSCHNRVMTNQKYTICTRGILRKIFILFIKPAEI